MGNYSKLSMSNIQKIGEHAYVSLPDCMVDLLRHEISMELIEVDASLKKNYIE